MGKMKQNVEPRFLFFHWLFIRQICNYASLLYERGTCKALTQSVAKMCEFNHEKDKVNDE